jgi:hypothetical protein
VIIDLDTRVRAQLLTNEARRWIGITEMGGDNRGQVVELFQRTVGIPPGSPWCLAFVQYCIAQVDRTCLIVTEGVPKTSKMAPGAGCLAVWGSTDPAYRSNIPTVGSIVIWKHTGSGEGHAGIVQGVLPDGTGFYTIEGNTSPGGGVIRNGEGVYAKTHTIYPTGPMELEGFISPWGPMVQQGVQV